MDDARVVGKWAVGLDRSNDGTMLRLEFSDKPPLTLLVPKDSARQIADAIIAQYKSTPPARLS